MKSVFPSGSPRDHGGGIDAARARFGGQRADWIDLSTGINPVPYPIPSFAPDAWTALPDKSGQEALLDAARTFWKVPSGADLIAAPGASSLIAQMPDVLGNGALKVVIEGPTYNEHAAAFVAAGWQVAERGRAPVRVAVHPNNPDGRYWSEPELGASCAIIDESFCDISPERSLVHMAADQGAIILKSFGKFWGLAGLRLGFAIGPPEVIQTFRDKLGPWPVSGPALQIATAALTDEDWATAARQRLNRDAVRLDALIDAAGGRVVGGTSLFRLYDVGDARDWQDRLARHQIWSRVFPYSTSWLRLGLPPGHGWTRLEQALT